jgi:hypothetical protein
MTVACLNYIAYQSFVQLISIEWGSFYPQALDVPYQLLYMIARQRKDADDRYRALLSPVVDNCEQNRVDRY